MHSGRRGCSPTSQHTKRAAPSLQLMLARVCQIGKLLRALETDPSSHLQQCSQEKRTDAYDSAIDGMVFAQEI